MFLLLLLLGPIIVIIIINYWLYIKVESNNL